MAATSAKHTTQAAAGVAIFAWIALTVAVHWRLANFASAHMSEQASWAVHQGGWCVYFAVYWARLLNERSEDVAGRMRNVETRSWPRKNLAVWDKMLPAVLMTLILLPTTWFAMKDDPATGGIGLLVGIGCASIALGLSYLLFRTFVAASGWVGRVLHRDPTPAPDEAADI